MGLPVRLVVVGPEAIDDEVRLKELLHIKSKGLPYRHRCGARIDNDKGTE